MVPGSEIEPYSASRRPATLVFVMLSAALFAIPAAAQDKPHIKLGFIGPVSGGNAQQGEPFYRVTVSLGRQAITAYGKPESLRPGMVLDADVLGERRALIEWIFEPLYSLGGKVASD